jgi:hypothetical protein
MNVLNNIGLMTDFGWNSNCDMTKMMNGNCGPNFQWSCSQGTCYLRITLGPFGQNPILTPSQ